MKKLVQKAPSELTPYSNNPRKNEDAVLKVSESIQAFGFQTPILCDEKFEIIAGHTRWKAALKLNLKKIPVVITDELSDDKKKAYRIADNRLQEFAEWDWEKLDLELEPLDDQFKELFDFEIPDYKEPLEGNIEDDEIPEEIETRCKTGDLWQLGNHRLLCGDATKKEDVERLMDGNLNVFILTDPPYGIDVIKNNSIGGGGPVGGKKNYKRTIGGDNIVKANSYRPIYGDDQSFNPACLFVVKGDKIIFGANYFANSLPESRGWFVWDKLDGMEGTTKNFSDVEFGWTSFDKPARLFRHRWQGLMKGSERGDKRCHPTQKPIQIILDLMEYYIPPDVNLIADLFIGSGSTLIACEKTNRICYGMEIDPHYCDVTIQRWEEFTGKTASKIE